MKMSGHKIKCPALQSFYDRRKCVLLRVVALVVNYTPTFQNVATLTNNSRGIINNPVYSKGDG